MRKESNVQKNSAVLTSDLNTQLLFEEYCTHEGFLHKKSPKILVGFQERYYTIRDQGNLLIYYKQQPNKDDQPQGILQIRDITVVKKNDFEFDLLVDTRIFSLKAKSREQCSKWVQTLIFLKEYKQKFEKQVQRPVSGKVEGQKAQWKLQNIDQEILNQVQLENENLNRDESKEYQIEEMNNEILEIKGLNTFIQNIDQEKIHEHMVCGFLFKKQSNIVESLLTAQKRFFIMFSSISLLDEDNKEEFDSSLLPSTMKPDIIYYFKYDGPNDQSEFNGSISIETVSKIELLDFKNKETQLLNPLQMLKSGVSAIGNKLNDLTGIGFGSKKMYGFQLTCTKREQSITYSFFSEYLTEANQWQNSIQQVTSILIAKKEEIYRKLEQAKKLALENGQEFKVDQEEINWRDQVVKADQLQRMEKVILGLAPTSAKLYVQLKREIIVFYQSEKQKNQSSNDYILIANITKVTPQKEQIFIISHDKGDTSLKTKTPEERNRWMEGIKRVQQQPSATLSELREGVVIVDDTNQNRALSQINSVDNDNENEWTEIGSERQSSQSRSLYGMHMSYEMDNNNNQNQFQISGDKQEQSQLYQEPKETFGEKFKRLCCCCCYQKKQVDYYTLMVEEAQKKNRNSY